MAVARARLSDAGGKSRAEIAALRHLRSAYDALASASASSAASSASGSAAATASTPLRPRSARVDTVRAILQQRHSPQPSVVDQWLTLEALAVDVAADVDALQREEQRCVAQCADRLDLPVDVTELAPKWQVLSEVLGRDAFHGYVRDVFAELAALRQRAALYGDRLRRFQDEVRRLSIGNHAIRDVVSHAECLDILNAALASLDGYSAVGSDGDTSSVQPASVLLLSHYPVLTQHCSGAEPDRVVLSELLALLEQLAPPRERLARICFEQLADARHRGTGVAPPPDGVRPHKLSARASASHADALSTRDELDEIQRWLATQESTVSMDAFITFHVRKSDEYEVEDAEFVAFLVRVWQLELADALQDVVGNYEARCQQLAAQTRKREVLKKLDHMQSALPAKLAALRLAVGEQESLLVPSPAQFEQLQRCSLATSTLIGLRVLRLVDLELREFPTFVVALPSLEELDLSDNRLVHGGALPLTLGGLHKLKRLLLARNELRDASFPFDGGGDSKVPLDHAWRGMLALDTLALDRNQLSQIPSAVLVLPKLRELSLAGNALRGTGIVPLVLQQWQQRGGTCQLAVLDVRENQLTALPDVLLAAVRGSLQRLHAQHNQLAELPPSLAALEQLRVLELAHNQLRRVDQDLSPLLARCDALHELTLHHNQLKHFPTLRFERPGVVVFRGIHAIRLHKNRLRSLPVLPAGAFAACRELELQHNALHELPDAFFAAFPELRVCRLQENALKALPDAIAQCRYLQVLEVHANRLERVPAQLGQLRELAVLSLRDNQLTGVPSEWHTFAQHEDAATRQRVLRSLLLQRNPLRNKVLQSLVDAASGQSHAAASARGSATPFKSSATQVCEMFVRKLIDALLQSVTVQAMARAVHTDALAEHADDDGNGTDDGDGADGETRAVRPRWKGRARFVVKHIERQLAPLCTRQRGHEWLLPVAAFRSLLQRLAVASTKKELLLVSERFQRTDTLALVDGMAFLRGVESVGLFNALPATTGAVLEDGTRCESVRKLGGGVDAVASILQYLQVAHAQKLRAAAEPVAAVVAPQASERPHSAVRRPERTDQGQQLTLRPQSAKSEKRTTRSTATATPQVPAKQATARSAPAPAAPAANVDGSAAKAVKEQTRELERQRQRIRVLEQQLLDQRVLQIEQDQQLQQRQQHQQHVSVTDVDATRGGSASQRYVTIHVKPLASSTSVRIASGKHEHALLTVSMDKTVRELKQLIQTKLHVDTSKQVLIARRVSDGQNVRLQNDAVLETYLDSAAARQVWNVSLLITKKPRVDHWATRTRAADAHSSNNGNAT